MRRILGRLMAVFAVIFVLTSCGPKKLEGTYRNDLSGISIEFNKDGTAWLAGFGEAGRVQYEVKGNTVNLMSPGENTIVGQLANNNNTIIITQQGVALEFIKMR